MDIEQARELCLSLPQVEESFPFDDVTLVMKVAGKMFALIPLDSEKKAIALKCDPDRSEHLRMHYEGSFGLGCPCRSDCTAHPTFVRSCCIQTP